MQKLVTNEISFDKINAVTNLTHSLKFHNAFKPKTHQILHRETLVFIFNIITQTFNILSFISQIFGLNIEYALPALCATIGAAGGKSTVEGINNKSACVFMLV